jgi:butyrate kinase
MQLIGRKDIEMEYYILAVNPGSTSTKMAVYKNEQEILNNNIHHPSEVLHTYDNIHDQYSFRYKTILRALEEMNFDIKQLSAVVGRGGFVRPIPSGTYLINEKMLHDLHHPWNEQESNLGGLIANEIAQIIEVSSFIVDPVVIDELSDVARISGLNDIERKSMFHALNQKATARKLAQKINLPYEEMKAVVAHMGGGISIGAHEHGQVIDVSNGLDGEGPFSPDRTGTLPLKPLVKMCYSGQYTEKDMLLKIKGKGGLYSYLGTNDAREIDLMAESHDEKAELLLYALAYKIAKEIGAYATVLAGDVDGIALTGGLANSDRITGIIQKHVQYIAPVFIFPGENEMESMVRGVLRVLDNTETAKVY